jgi:large subunit ribosomal protein L9
MKVILLRDVAKIGKRFEVVNVPDGYALNKLIPKGDAQAATPDNLKRVTNMKAKGASDKEAQLSSIKAMVDSLAETPLEVPMQANEQGHLFQAVRAEDVAKAAEARGAKLPKESIVIATPIKTTGAHAVTVKSQGQSFTLSINVVAK